jgi:pyruvate kinase
LNFSHATVEEHTRTFHIIRKLEHTLQLSVPILQDLAGPKIRIGPLRGGVIDLQTGHTLTITSTPIVGTSRRISTTYPRLAREVHRGDRLLLNDGAVELVVEATPGSTIRARVIRGGSLSEHKGINLPGVKLRVPALTKKDLHDLDTGVHLGVDYVALSFVRRAADIAVARRALDAHGVRIPLIAKLEKAEAIEALDDILRAADGVMVARGDLGVELAPERVPILQKAIIERANAVGIPVITATQMLESMVHNERPTRAEASDVANAILDGTDALMLSEETAIGDYPIEAVRIMDRIAQTAEGATAATPIATQDSSHSTMNAVAAAACNLARALRVRAIVIITRTGRTAELVSKHRPQSPIVAFTEHQATARRLALWWGIDCYATGFKPNTDAMIAHIETEMISRRLAATGDTIVLVGSAPMIVRGRTNFVKIHRVRSRGKRVDQT